MRIVRMEAGAAGWAAETAAKLGADILGEGWESGISEIVEQAFWQAMEAATLGLDKADEEEPWNWFNPKFTVILA